MLRLFIYWWGVSPIEAPARELSFSFFVFFVQILRPCKPDSAFRRSGFFVFFVPIMQSGEGKTAFSPHPRPGMRLSIWTNEKDSSNTNVRCCRFSPTSPAALSLSLSLSLSSSLSLSRRCTQRKEANAPPTKPGKYFFDTVLVVLSFSSFGDISCVGEMPEVREGPFSEFGE